MGASQISTDISYENVRKHIDEGIEGTLIGLIRTTYFLSEGESEHGK